MTRARSATPKLRALFVTLALRSTTRLRLPRKLMSEIPGQSCRALPACQSSKRANKRLMDCKSDIPFRLLAKPPWPGWFLRRNPSSPDPSRSDCRLAVKERC